MEEKIKQLEESLNAIRHKIQNLRIIDKINDTLAILDQVEKELQDYIQGKHSSFLEKILYKIFRRTPSNIKKATAVLNVVQDVRAALYMLSGIVK